jgi:hypothetical protein
LPLSWPDGRRARIRFDWRRCAVGAGDLVITLLAATPSVGVAPCKGAVFVQPLRGGMVSMIFD